MRLSKKITKSIDDDLIVRINEIYHDFENTTYHSRHQHMFAGEIETWKDLTTRFIESSVPKVCLDYGSGTGFVPLNIGPWLNSQDKIICTDLSEEILKTCQSNLEKRQLSCETEFRKVDGVTLPFEPDSVDVVTLNSVLHHVPNLESFAAEVLRVLKPNGLLIVAHEPNNNTCLPETIRRVIRMVNALLSPSKIAFSMVEKSALLESILRKLLSRVSEKYSARNKMLEDISRILVEEGHIDFKLRGTEVQQLVDIHTEEGLSKANVLEAFSRFSLVEWRTYGSLIPPRNTLLKKLNNAVKKQYPDSGRSFCFVLKKPYIESERM